MWKCKECSEELSSRYLLLRHFRQKHGHFRGSYRYPCPYTDCPCTFITWSKLLNHTYKSHAKEPTSLEISTFQCHVCSCRELSEKDFFQHLNAHLRRNETVPCVFSGCTFKTNVYSTFHTHKNRKHNQHSLKDFQANLICTNLNELDDSVDVLTDSKHVEHEYETLNQDDFAEINLTNSIEEKIACILLKLENIVHIPKAVVDEVLSELHNILSCESLPLTKATVSSVFQNHCVHVEDSVVDELASVICKSNPLGIAIAKDGPLATAYKRKQYYTSHFKVVQPVEYILDAQKKRTFQYIPLLQSLQHLLSQEGVLDHIETPRTQDQPLSGLKEYRTIRDSKYFKQNTFLSSENYKIAINLYVDDFEICNPLGTSPKKHKLCGVYWVLGNLPPGSHSKLSSIYLAVLCKSDDAKAFGYRKVLEPLLQDLIILEQHGVFISQIGQFVKGTVQCLIADNLGAHAIGGFVESFSCGSICRFCTGDRSEFQTKDVSSGAFILRTKDIHDNHVLSAQESERICCGVKKQCVLTEHLSHFHVNTGYPPDIVHDLFEGVVQVELARCLSLLISKKYLTLDLINTLIQTFPFKWGDKTNRPHTIPRSFTSSNTLGGNAHENWALLRFLPFLIGCIVPEDEPAWLVILDLKDIVELVVAPVHTDETIAYLEAKIYDHRQRFLELFPHVKLLPKHHYLEHYPEMIRCFGSLVALWTMRFEAKHSFFKQVARHTNCFKNIPRSLAIKHQFMLAYHTHTSIHQNSSLEVTDVSIMPVDVLSEELRYNLHQRYPEVTEVHMTKNVSYNGIRYNKGMLIVHGTENGLPKFNEIIQLCIVKEKLCFLVRGVCAWYREHFGSFELTASPTREVALIELADIEDPYPLVEYTVGGLHMVVLKRFVIVKGQ